MRFKCDFKRYWLVHFIFQNFDDTIEEVLRSTKIKHIRKALKKVFYLLLASNDFEGVIPKDANNLKITRCLVQILQTLAYSLTIRRWTVGKHMFKTVI